MVLWNWDYEGGLTRYEGISVGVELKWLVCGVGV